MYFLAFADRTLITAVLLAVLLLCSIVAITIRSRVYCVIFLIFSYAIAAIISALFSLTFISVAVLIIYVGAISVFFLFIVMSLSEEKTTLSFSFDFFTSLTFFLILLASTIVSIWIFFTSLDLNSIITQSAWLGDLKNEVSMQFFFFGKNIYYWVTSGDSCVNEFANLSLTFENGLTSFIDKLNGETSANFDNNSRLSVQDKFFFKIIKLSDFLTTNLDNSRTFILLDYWLDQYLKLIGSDENYLNSFIRLEKTVASLATFTGNLDVSFIAQIVEINDALRIGMVLYTRFSVGVVMGGLLLLVAIVGVTMIFDIIPKSNKSREVVIEQLLRVSQRGTIN